MTEIIALHHSIDGIRRESPKSLQQPSPAEPTDLLIRIPEASTDDVDDAARAAARAQSQLADIGIEARSDALAGIGRRIVANADALSLLIARETGKTIRDAKGEVLRAARIFDFFSGEALRTIGERFDSTRRHAVVEVTRTPVGVVGLITPWNFPIAIPAWKIAPALAFGNTVVWKPSEVSSATANALMDILLEAGLPPGSINMVLGAGATGEAVCAHADIGAVSFTGSQAAGAKVRSIVCARNGRLQLEMGGINGLIVMADASLDTAVECAVNGAYFAAGQRCTATSRIIVEAPIVDAFVSRLRTRVSGLTIGDPRNETTDIGPLANQRQKQVVSAQIAALRGEGLISILEPRKNIDSRDCYVSPLLFDHVGQDSLLMRQEIFGPVAGLFRARDFSHAMALLNDSPGNLSAGICTTSLAHAEAFKRKARAGMLMINLPTAGVDHHAPFGGCGNASYGEREQGRAAVNFYTLSKTAYQFSG